MYVFECIFHAEFKYDNDNLNFKNWKKKRNGFSTGMTRVKSVLIIITELV